MFAAKDLFATRGGYNIAKSLRFRSSASAYLSRTPGSAGNRKTWTWSGWVKRGSLGAAQMLFIGYVDINNKTRIDISSGDVLRVYDITGGSTERVKVNTTQVFRDPSAWYHIVVVIDTTSATSTVTGSSTDRVRIYINGSQVSSFSSSVAPAQNTDLYVNATNAHAIGGSPPDSIYLDGYLSEINFIDGQALTPSDFGQTDTATGVWMPKAYTGTYGTNGFYLKFADASGATATTIGKDSSGNGNNWTPNNISVTAGVTYDSMVDTPTNYDNGGNGAGNYAVLNPLDKGSIITLSAGNLTCDYSGTATDACTFSTIAFDAGSTNFYAEFTLTAISLASSDVAAVGIADVNTVSSASISTSGTAVLYLDSGSKVVNGTTTAFGASWTTNDVIGVYVNQGTITFYKNGTSQGNAATGVSGTYKFVIRGRSGVSRTFTVSANFGQRTYSNTPSGAKALCTQNLPTPTIGATSSTLANKYFDASLYTGTGASQSITNSGAFQPDLLWIKSRSVAASHILVDAVRTVSQELSSNDVAAETTNSGRITSFNSNGWSFGATAAASLNQSSATYVGWQWKANGSGSSNTSGSITSTVSANVTAGFSVVTYTGTGANATVGHGLGVAPRMIIIKSRSNVNNWPMYVAAMNDVTGYIFLNLANAKQQAAVYWNSTNPTSSVFSLGTTTDVNGSGTTFVAYCFAEVAGYSKFGSYTGNGSADGPFCYTGFRPRYIMIKRTDTVESWNIVDTARDTYNQSAATLFPNLSNAEGSNNTCDILSNGFKLRNTWAGANASGGTYVYACFAETPFNYSRGR